MNPRQYIFNALQNLSASRFKGVNEGIPYECDEPVRSTSVVFLVGFSGFWFAFVGYGLLVKREPFTVESSIGTGVFVLLVCFFVFLIFKGGVWHIEMNDDHVRWYGPLHGDLTIRHGDVESFEVVVSGGDSGGSPSTRVLLKSGETVILPSTGDQQVVHQLLLRKWNFRGERET